MVETASTICKFGWKAQEFALKGTDGRTWRFADVRGRNGTLIIFLSNTCPYVRAVIGRIEEEAKALQAIGIGVIGIMSNVGDPRDSFDAMKEFARQNGFSFPYVEDPTQEVARAYDAQCTPDFFGFNANDELQYRGRLDASRRETRSRRAPRPVRGDEADRGNRPRSGRTDREHGMRHQVAGKCGLGGQRE